MHQFSRQLQFDRLGDDLLQILRRSMSRAVLEELAQRPLVQRPVGVEVVLAFSQAAVSLEDSLIFWRLASWEIWRFSLCWREFSSEGKFLPAVSLAELLPVFWTLLAAWLISQLSIYPFSFL